MFNHPAVAHEGLILLILHIQRNAEKGSEYRRGEIVEKRRNGPHLGVSPRQTSHSSCLPAA